MAAPAFVDASTGATDAGGVWSFTCQAPAQAGNVIIVQILLDGSSTGSVAQTGASNIEDLAGTDNAWTSVTGGWSLVGGTGEARQQIWIGRALSTTAPTISGTNSTSEDLYFRSYQFQDVSTGTTLATVIENGTAGYFLNGTGTTDTASDTAVTTLGPDRLALNFVAVNDDNAISAFTGESGGDWVHVTGSPYAESSGTDGAIALMAATLPGPQQESDTALGYNLGSVSGTLYTAQSFTSAATAGLVSVEIKLGADTGSPSDDLTVSIRADSAGKPSSTDLASKTLTDAEITPSAWNTFTFSASLSASTKYWIVVHRSGAADGSNFHTWRRAGDLFSGEARCASSDGTTWGATGVEDLCFRVHGGGATIDGGTENHVDSDAWGVVGFALIGTTVSGPTEHFGAATTAFTGTFTSVGTHPSAGASAAAFTGTFVTQGARTQFGTTSADYTATFTTAGTHPSAGASAASFTGTFTTVGTHPSAGAVVEAYTGTFTTQGSRTVSGASTSAYTGTLTTQGSATRTGASVSAYTGTFTTQGLGLHYGDVQPTFAGTFTTQGVTTRFGAVVDDLTATFVTQGTVSAGVTEWFGAVSQDYTGTLTTQGTAEHFATAISDYSATFTSAGFNTATGVATQDFTATFTIQGSRTSSGVSTTAFTGTFTTQGLGSHFGAAAEDETGTFTTAGFNTTAGAATSAYTLDAVTQGQTQGQVAGSVVTDFTLGSTTSGTVTVFARRALVSWVALEVPAPAAVEWFGATSSTFTAEITTQGYPTLVGSATQDFTATFVTTALVEALGTLSAPFTATFVTQGQQQGVQFGASSADFLLGATTLGVLDAHGASAALFVGTFTTQGFRTSSGVLVLPFTATFTTQGTGAHAVSGASVSPFTGTFTTSAQSAIKVGQSVVTLSLTETTAGYTTTQGVIVLPLAAALTSAGYASVTSQSMQDFLLDIITSGRREGAPLTMLPEVLAGHIGYAKAGEFEPRDRIRVATDERGMVVSR